MLDVQTPATKDEFYRRLLDVGTDLRTRVPQWTEFKLFLDEMTSGDLDALGVPVGTKNEIAKLRTLLGEMLGFFNGDQVQATNNPMTLIREFSRL